MFIWKLLSMIILLSNKYSWVKDYTSYDKIDNYLKSLTILQKVFIIECIATKCAALVFMLISFLFLSSHDDLAMFLSILCITTDTVQCLPSGKVCSPSIYSAHHSISLYICISVYLYIPRSSSHSSDQTAWLLSGVCLPSGIQNWSGWVGLVALAAFLLRLETFHLPFNFYYLCPQVGLQTCL